MKKRIFFLILLLVFPILLSSCKAGKPELIEKYKLEKVSFEKADKEEWEPTKIDEEFSYISDFFHNDKEGYFLRIYKNNELFYEEISDENFYIKSAAHIGQYIYLCYWQPKEKDGNNAYPNYLVRYDQSFNKEILLTEYEEAIEKILFYDNSFILLKSNRATQQKTLIEMDYSCQMLHSKELDRSISFLTEENGTLYFKNYEENYLNVYAFTFEEGLKLFYCGIGYSLNFSTIENGVLTYVSYRHAYNGVEIWYYNGKDIKCILKVPTYYEDLVYSCNNAVSYNGHVFIPVHTSIKNSMSFYSKMFIFHYDEKKEEITVIYLDKNAQHSLIKNNKIYLGRYYGEKSDTYDGEFYALNLENFN